jgi:hypothetical protein
MESINQAGVASIDQMLSGQLPGSSNSGNRSSGRTCKIRIRGTALSGQDPLWVIDGLPLEGNDVLISVIKTISTSFRISPSQD